MADEVSFEVEDRGTHTVVRPSGYLDISTSPSLRDLFRDLPAAAGAVVILDLGSIEFLDSSALGVILNGWKRMQARGATLVVVSPQERVTKIFEVTALTLSIKVYASFEQAAAELGV